MNCDVVTLGETMLRLTPPGFERIEQASQLELHVGGSESNTATGLARLGIHVIWLSRLTANPLGRHIANAIRAQGVDVSHVIWTDADRVGTYYMERGKPPRDSQVFYDRAESAMSRMTPDDLPHELFRAGGALVFHTTGITLGISASATATAERAARLAKDAGWLVSFDMNYRAKLWSLDAAQQGCDPLMRLADLIFLPCRDAVKLLALDANTPPQQIAEQLAQRYPQATIVLTRGAEGAIAVEPSGRVYNQPAFLATEVERLGGGDAFSSGFLAGYLRGGLELALPLGAAAAAIKYTIPGDLPLFDREAVERLASGKVQTGIAR